MSQPIQVRMVPNLNHVHLIQGLGFNKKESEAMKDNTFMVRNGNAFPDQEYFIEGTKVLTHGKLILAEQIEIVG